MRPSKPRDPADSLDRVDDALIRAGRTLTNDRAFRARATLLGAGFAAALVVIVGVAGYMSANIGGEHAYNRAAAHTDQRVAVLESDLAARRFANRERDQFRDEQIAELRRLVCIFADHAQPRDAQVQQVRARYQCNGGPYPMVVPSPGPTG